MSRKKIMFFALAIGVLLVIGSAFLVGATPVKAQCGSQVSSCKNCHETQGQKPVNNDGTAWHTQHAFGDFCYLCHAGNNQATDKVAAHTGMVAPLSDISANCKSCHPNDTQAKAQIYATTLGVQVGTGGGAPAATLNQPAATRAPAATQASAQAAPAGGAVVQSPDVVDYVQQYDQSASGAQPVNTGNIIAGVLVALLLVGGAGMVIWNERRKKAAANSAPGKKEVSPIDPQTYPKEVLALLPKIAALNPVGRKSLEILLKNPDAASELLHTIAQLDPDLVRMVKSLDLESQALLIALSQH
jgi:hypothetical protein